jgi:hypothetical protein
MKFAYDVSILLDITVDDVRTLQICAALHYDGVCRAAGVCGGFLYGWMNRFELFANDNEPTEIYATAREIGISSKLLEMTLHNRPTHAELWVRLHLAAAALSDEHCRVNEIRKHDAKPA